MTGLRRRALQGVAASVLLAVPMLALTRTALLLGVAEEAVTVLSVVTAFGAAIWSSWRDAGGGRAH